MYIKGESKYALGQDMYLCSSFWQSKARVHIRRFKRVPSPIDTSQTIVIPTRHGVSLDVNQLRKMVTFIPALLSDLDKLRDREVGTYLAEGSGSHGKPPTDVTSQKDCSSGTLHRPVCQRKSARTDESGPKRLRFDNQTQERSETQPVAEKNE